MKSLFPKATTVGFISHLGMVFWYGIIDYVAWKTPCFSYRHCACILRLCMLCRADSRTGGTARTSHLILSR